jgi:hypothetical protein
MGVVMEPRHRLSPPCTAIVDSPLFETFFFVNSDLLFLGGSLV